jgi:hypothetical protein
MKISNYILIAILVITSFQANASTSTEQFCSKWKKVTARHGGEDLNNGGQIVMGSSLIASDLYYHGTDESIFSTAIDQLKDGQSICVYGVLSTDQENIYYKVLDKITGIII